MRRIAPQQSSQPQRAAAWPCRPPFLRQQQCILVVRTPKSPAGSAPSFLPASSRLRYAAQKGQSQLRITSSEGTMPA